MRDRFEDGQSVEFPFNWFPQRVGSSSSLSQGICALGFHSIGFPSEWGAQVIITPLKIWICQRFPFNWFPQRVGSSQLN